MLDAAFPSDVGLSANYVLVKWSALAWWIRDWTFGVIFGSVWECIITEEAWLMMQ